MESESKKPNGVDPVVNEEDPGQMGLFCE